MHVSSLWRMIFVSSTSDWTFVWLLYRFHLVTLTDMTIDLIFTLNFGVCAWCLQSGWYVHAHTTNSDAAYNWHYSSIQFKVYPAVSVDNLQIWFCSEWLMCQVVIYWPRMLNLQVAGVNDCLSYNTQPNIK